MRCRSYPSQCLIFENFFGSGILLRPNSHTLTIYNLCMYIWKHAQGEGMRPNFRRPGPRRPPLWPRRATCLGQAAGGGGGATALGARRSAQKRRGKKRAESGFCGRPKARETIKGYNCGHGSPGKRRPWAGFAVACPGRARRATADRAAPSARRPRWGRSAQKARRRPNFGKRARRGATR